jgi:hypothetical protein
MSTDPTYIIQCTIDDKGKGFVLKLISPWVQNLMVLRSVGNTKTNGIKPSTFASRIKNGWSMERAISTPTRRYADRRRGLA